MTFDLRMLAAGALLVGTCASTAPTAPDPRSTQTRLTHTRSIAATCGACHGTDGAAVPGEAMVALAGYPRAAFVAQLKAFRDGTREATVMHQIARGYSDDEIDALAGYFATRRAGSR